MRNILASLFCVLSICGFTNTNISASHIEKLTISTYSDFESIPIYSDSNFTKTKIIAISLAITLGAFGVHRLYLGTKPLVPLAYTLTLGGGFLILPILDIIYILFAKDMEDIKNNDYVFMWNKKKKPKKTIGN